MLPGSEGVTVRMVVDQGANSDLIRIRMHYLKPIVALKEAVQATDLDQIKENAEPVPNIV